MDRISFFNKISGIDYPEMIVHFFDHFLALKQIVEDYGFVQTLSHDNESITFKISFSDMITKNTSMNIIYALGGSIVIYGKPIVVTVVSSEDLAIIINLNGVVS